MCFKYIAYTLINCVLIHGVTVKIEDDKSKEEIEDITDYDSHTFVALIDIVFADGNKRTCTGSIIHDNVVITAAHCFVHEYENNIKPELTASFVVIGSKKMFDSGYEQYLPIERIVTHPQFRGWTADLSLVYTFAGMTSDKPGKVIPLAGERVSNPVDSNVTVFSWGHCKDQQIVQTWHITPQTPATDSSSLEDSDLRATVGVNEKRARGSRQHPQQHPQHQQQQLVEAIIPEKYHKPTSLRQQHRFQTEYRDQNQRGLLYEYPMMGKKLREHEPPQKTVKKKKVDAKQLSRYLPSDEDEEGFSNVHPIHKSMQNFTFAHHKKNKIEEQIRGRFVTDEFPQQLNSLKSFFKNWRRSMGSEENKLTVEVFGFVNLATCKKIVEGAMPPRYEIKNGEVACYSSEEHYLTDEDAGAPAVRQGQLVAVTVGGAQCDGDQVAVGMKMSCYCDWIADNLPESAPDMNCCKNCCDVNKHSEEPVTKKGQKKKNKYLYK